ncbi:uncharacterized protein MELLADRAFT_103529 [Melampsora larici-populina 98AG31]|uniref:Uncharacterized protein n=1 Tax=Melampsora larici-populina (strain 98AG31 / pathotype 3-4-7) TaxID=747676 RepID=F4RBM6_MELLP|nr:uncharacterized protein MELLADRAFT_103529 [Melampsora larici-populina 98AG31]EGG10308.1 hypothetical protein MELLADRAFT_103529 [Melampsora larici-populina 98AG31]
MSSPITNRTAIQFSPSALTPGLHISSFPVSSAAASSILELIKSTRGSAERVPVSIPLTAHPGVHQGQDQCMKCGIFGHRSYQCAQTSNSAEPIPDWRRTTNGKIYSLKALLGMPPYCKWTMDTLLEDTSNQNIYDKSPSGTPTPISVTTDLSNGQPTDLNTRSMNLDPPSTNSNPNTALTKIIDLEIASSPDRIDLTSPNATPKATSLSNKIPSIHSHSKQSTRQAFKGKQTQAFNPVVSPWNDWSKIWSWRPNSTTAAAAISESVTGLRVSNLFISNYRQSLDIEL